MSAEDSAANRNGLSLAEVRLQCLDRARAMYPGADPDLLTRVAETFSRFVANGNTFVRVDDGDSFRYVSVAPAYRPDLDPFTETETARMMGVV